MRDSRDAGARHHPPTGNDGVRRLQRTARTSLWKISSGTDKFRFDLGAEAPCSKVAVGFQLSGNDTHARRCRCRTNVPETAWAKLFYGCIKQILEALFGSPIHAIAPQLKYVRAQAAIVDSRIAVFQASSSWGRVCILGQFGHADTAIRRGMAPLKNFIILASFCQHTTISIILTLLQPS
jgi:hypothetical protein